MDFATRDQYRRTVEQIAKGSPTSEDEVARRAVALASAEHAKRPAPRAPALEAPETHVGYFLVDEGRARLERDVGARRPVAARLAAVSPRGRFALYVAALTLMTAAMAVGLTLATPVRHWGAGALAVAVAVFVIASSQLAVGLVHWAATLRWVPPQVLPTALTSRREHIPSDHRATEHCVPVLLHGPPRRFRRPASSFPSDRSASWRTRDPSPAARVGRARQRFSRRPTRETMPGDDALLTRAIDGVKALERQVRRLDAVRERGPPSSCSTARGGSNPARGRLDGLGSASAASSRSSTPPSAAKRRRSRRSSASPRACATSSTSSSSTATRSCRAIRRSSSWARWRTGSTVRSTTRPAGAWSAATRSSSLASPSR